MGIEVNWHLLQLASYEQIDIFLPFFFKFLLILSIPKLAIKCDTFVCLKEQV